MRRDACFEEFKKSIADDKDFQKAFKDWLKEDNRWKKYTDAKNWNNVNRQLNRIIADAEGRSVQRRSGTKTFNDWLKNAISDFAEAYTEALGSSLMKGTHGGSGIVVGDFAMFETGDEFRGRFVEMSQALNYASHLRAVIPYKIAVDCSGGVWVSYL